MRVFGVYNGRAGAGRSRRLLPAIEAALRDRGVEVEMHFTRAPGHAIELVAAAGLDGFDAVVAAGGDGTVFEVLNGLYQRERADRPPLGVIPVGTGNAFARDLGLEPDDWRGAVGLIGAGRTRRIDVGRVHSAADRFHFLNIVGIGLPVTAGLTARRLKPLGRSAYTLGTLWQVLKLSHGPVELELDGVPLSEESVFVEISNTRYTGTHFQIAPQARMDDGLLDVTLLRPLSRRRLLRLFPTVYSGGHLRFEEVRTYRARTIRITSPAGSLLGVDGEFRGQTPVEVTCLPRDLELLG